jgi:hypothetical protein
LSCRLLTQHGCVAFGGVSPSARSRRSRSCNSVWWYGESGCRITHCCQTVRVGF